MEKSVVSDQGISEYPFNRKRLQVQINYPIPPPFQMKQNKQQKKQTNLNTQKHTEKNITVLFPDFVWRVCRKF